MVAMNSDSNQLNGSIPMVMVTVMKSMDLREINALMYTVSHSVTDLAVLILTVMDGLIQMKTGRLMMVLMRTLTIR